MPHFADPPIEMKACGQWRKSGVGHALFCAAGNFGCRRTKSVPLWMRTRRRFYNLEENRKWKKNRMLFWRGSLSES